MEQIQSNHIIRAPVEPRNPGSNGSESSGQAIPTRPTLTRADSRSAFPPQSLRPGGPQQRPQFQPGGPVNCPPQLGSRPGNPVQRGPGPAGPPGSPQVRSQSPAVRPVNQPNSSNQGSRPVLSPTSTQPPQRPQVPNNLQFGPRQPPQFNNVTTPEGSRPQLTSQTNGPAKTGVTLNSPVNVPLSRQPSQGSLKGIDSSNLYQNKPVNLENQNSSNENQNITKFDSSDEMPGATKSRSFSIAVAPGAPSPLKMDDDRRKSVSSVSGIGGRFDDLGSRSSGLSLIQEMRGSKDNMRGSRDSVRSEASTEGTKDVPERPESRLAGSKMTESFMGSLSNLSKKKQGDDDDVISQNNLTSVKADVPQNKTDLSDRSPSLTRSEESPEPKNVSQSSVSSNKTQSLTPEPQRPKTPKTEIKQELKSEANNVMKSTTATPNKSIPKSPVSESKSPVETKPPASANKKSMELKTSVTPSDSKKSTPRKVVSTPNNRPKDGDNDSGVDESTQGNDLNGSPSSPNKKLPSKLPTKEKSSSSLKQNLSRSSSKSATAKTPETPQPNEKKKKDLPPIKHDITRTVKFRNLNEIPMNKVQVGSAPSPNIKAVKSKIGSLENTTYKPGGGKVKIENRKLDFNNVTPKIAAKNEAYTPSGGAKKITTTKLEWNAKSKIGSLQNSSYKPGGGDKKIETVKLDFKEKAKPKVASTVNITHKPGGGAVKTIRSAGTRPFVRWALPRWRASNRPCHFYRKPRRKIENQKLEFKAQSKVGSLDNVKHKPGGGDIKIFDDKDYIKQIGGHSPLPNSHGQSRQESPVPPSAAASAQLPKADENLNQQPC